MVPLGQETSGVSTGHAARRGLPLSKRRGRGGSRSGATRQDPEDEEAGGKEIEGLSCAEVSSPRFEPAIAQASEARARGRCNARASQRGW